MDFKVIWSDAAIADLHQICSYIAGHDPQAARRIGEGILDHVRILASFPFIGPFRSYRIFYDVPESPRSVEILHVWHSARDEPTF